MKKILAFITAIAMCLSLAACTSDASSRKKGSSSGKVTTSDASSRKNGSSSGKVTGSGAGGYDMPNESDKSFSDYVKRVDPELYDSLVGN